MHVRPCCVGRPASVIRSHIRTTKILRLSQNLPVVVEIVDAQKRIDAFLPILDEMMTNGLVTIGKVQVFQYGEAKMLADDGQQTSPNL